MQASTAPAGTIVAQPDHEQTCVVLARVRGDLENLLAGPTTPAALAPDLQAALALVKRAAGSNFIAWASAPDAADDDAPDFDADDPYADEPLPFDLTEAGLAAAAGVG
jgi:hypothetical protein